MKPWWLTEEEKEALRRGGEQGEQAVPTPSPPVGVAARHVLGALRQALIQASWTQDAQSRRAAVHVAATLVEMGAPAMGADAEWSQRVEEVRAHERLTAGEPLPRWWTPELSRKRAEALISIAYEMHLRGISSLGEFRRALLGGLGGSVTLTDLQLPTAGEVLTGIKQHRGPRKPKGSRDEPVDCPDSRERATAPAA